MGAFVDWLADLGARLILEFVSPDGPMVGDLTLNTKPHEIHRDYNETDLRRYLDGRFVIEREDELPGGTRRLFALRPIA